jgi:sugar fermentation stimulation protein A
MKYQQVVEGIFWERPNRFVAFVTIKGETHRVHVKNTGRCRELLLPGSRVFLSKSDNPNRKTVYDLIAVVKEAPFGNKDADPILVNIDSQAPNAAFGEYVRAGYFLPGVEKVKGEFTYGNSRLDYFVKTEDREVLCEIKGVTLEEQGVALFPDAPTERGIKHLMELIRGVKEGYDAYAVFVIQMKGVHAFSPHDGMHPEFGEAVREAKKNGVNLLALECDVNPDQLFLPQGARSIPVILPPLKAR